MFGYLLPEKQELKVKEYALYRAAYCGICRAIKLAYGDLPRFSVSYDAAVLAVLLVGVSGSEPMAKKRRCVLNPISPKPVLEGHDALTYVAAISVMLAWGKLKDSWADEKRVIALPAMAGLKLAILKARRQYPGQAAQIEKCLSELSVLEKANCKEIDRPADIMGNLMSGIVTSGPSLNPAAKVLLRSMGYHLGRWIYLVDALDDVVKDGKSGSYNAIIAMGGDAAAIETAEKACLYSASQVAAVFDLLDFKWGRQVISNVLYMGMPSTFRKVTNKEKAINDRSVDNAWGQAGLK